jgi:peptide-methionine (S)-S-oxide reductase
LTLILTLTLTRYARPIVTEVKAATAFWPAENYHQRYLQKGGQSAEKNAPEKVRCYG